MDEKLKSENMQKSSFLCLYYILRAIGAGRCRERRYADHIFIQIYFRMHHFVFKFSFKIFLASGDKGALTPLTKILRTFLFQTIKTAKPEQNDSLHLSQLGGENVLLSVCLFVCLFVSNHNNIGLLQLLQLIGSQLPHRYCSLANKVENIVRPPKSRPTLSRGGPRPPPCGSMNPHESRQYNTKQYNKIIYNARMVSREAESEALVVARGKDGIRKLENWSTFA